MKNTNKNKIIKNYLFFEIKTKLKAIIKRAKTHL